jgi:hypothetical protein
MTEGILAGFRLIEGSAFVAGPPGLPSPGPSCPRDTLAAGPEGPAASDRCSATGSLSADP